MAGPKDVILAQFANAEQLMQWFTSDLSDAEYFKPPVPRRQSRGLDHRTRRVFRGFDRGRHHRQGDVHPCGDPRDIQGGEDCLPDAARYPSRKQVDELLRDSRAHTREAIRDFDDKRWNDPLRRDGPRSFFPRSARCGVCSRRTSIGTLDRLPSAGPGCGKRGSSPAASGLTHPNPSGSTGPLPRGRGTGLVAIVVHSTIRICRSALGMSYRTPSVRFAPAVGR